MYSSAPAADFLVSTAVHQRAAAFLFSTAVQQVLFFYSVQHYTAYTFLNSTAVHALDASFYSVQHYASSYFRRYSVLKHQPLAFDSVQH
jgi:hypothetical protein